MKFKFKSVLGTSAAVALAAIASVTVAQAAGGETPHVARQSWSFSGIRGTYDRAQLQRGFQVYKEVCSSCHSANRLSFRNLSEPGGPEFPEEGVKNLAATYQVVDGPNDDGKMFKRPAKLSDPIPPPFTNENEARSANNGAYPPNLALITKARGVHVDKPFWRVPIDMVVDVASGYQEGGADYVYALLTGYADEPAYKDEGGKLTLVPAADAKGNRSLKRCVSVERTAGKPDTCVKIGDGMNYNLYFPGQQIAMGNPLSDGIVKYTDGSPQTLDQYAKDVTAFLAWAGEPKLEERKRLGLMTMLYLLITTILLYFAKKRIWSRVPH